jgi:8-oxo-dGTP diphosphatase
MKRRPLIGVGAVVFNARDEILLIKRGKEPHYGRWMVPGGTLEWGETLEQAVIREVHEETGVEIRLDGFVEIIEAIVPGDAGFHYVIMDYVATHVAGEPVAGDDALEATWAGPSRLGELDLTEDLVAVIDKARRITGRRA